MGEPGRILSRSASQKLSKICKPFKHDFRVTSLCKGFSILEVLIVILVIGVLCASGVSLYSGVTQDSRLRTINDRIQVFFSACKQRATLRRLPVKLKFENNTLSTDQTNLLSLKISELQNQQSSNLNGITFTASQTLDFKSRPINKLLLSIMLPGHNLATISINLEKDLL
jgi:prepilin-type N-terminal cleavage/methylation domain-containing protein